MTGLMHPMLMDVYLRQASLQCRFAVLAGEQLNSARDEVSTEKTWWAIQNLLGASANLSKLFWGAPKNPSLAVARAPLRRLVNLEETSPLRSMVVRNAFEHFDDRIDTWWRESQARGSALYVDGHIGMPFDPSIDRRSVFRHYDTRRRVVTFWGDEINLQDLLSEVQRIVPAIDAALEVRRPAGGQPAV